MNDKMLAVFDLDFTVWDCGGTWCDHTNPPYKKIDDMLVDKRGRTIYLYNNIIPILKMLQSKKIQLASASRTGEPGWAKSILELFDIYDYFHYHEIYPGSKLQHFKQLHYKSGIPYNKMIFFDDEYRNISEVESMGVKSVHVTEINRYKMEDILEQWLIEKGVSEGAPFSIK